MPLTPPAFITVFKQICVAWWNGDEPPPLKLVWTEFKRWFADWWNGNDFLRATLNRGTLPGLEARHTEAPRQRGPSLPARARVSEELWGPGNLTPGPAEYIAEHTAMLGLTSEMSMIDLGAGLGGPSRAISTAFGIWITPYEEELELAKVGMEQSTMHGMSRKVPVTHADFASIKWPQRKLDCFFSKETFHQVSDKAPLLAAVELALKLRGQFFIIDYVATTKSKDSSQITAWNEIEDKPSHFWTREEYAAGFAGAKLELRVTEDLTPKYTEFITEGFRGLSKKIDALVEMEKDPAMQSELRRALAYESKRWAIRAEALQSGSIAAMRFSGITNSQPQIR